uniref:Reverse transcriptase domain-containing protein n=1 Tax=Termitomyces sp. TaxID=1916073 RepID=A0A386TYM2_9AGAR|nr:hypothetical protein C0995_000021 [Termitomyces sp.]
MIDYSSSTGIMTPVNPLNNNKKGSRLNAAIMFNETWSWGSTKWEKGNSRHRYLSTLPSLVTRMSWGQLNFHLKNGSATISHLLSGLKSTKIGNGRPRTLYLWIHSNGYTITGNNSLRSTSYKLDQSKCKHGNPGKLRFIILMPDRNKVSQTCDNSKLLSEYRYWHGGKILDQANAKGNALDTRGAIKSERFPQGALHKSVLPNSICLNGVSLKPFGGRNNILDLVRARYMSTLPKKSTSLQALHEEVLEKQRELVKLAKLKGCYDKSVLDKQLVLVRSKLFREYAVMIISVKAGSQTPWIDKEIYNKEGEHTYVNLVESLREATYYPNKYISSPIKRVWIPKPGKSEKRPLGIPTIRDRALQALVNLALLPLVEMTSDPNSYGFRPHRDCKMAIAAVRNQLKTTNLTKVRTSISKRFNKVGNQPAHLMRANQDKWILDADIKGFFDNINHKWLMDNIFLHPCLKKLLEQWLKAKIFDAGIYIDPLSGTPQGGIISPTLANFTLNGLEKTVKNSLSPLTKSDEQRMQVKLRDGTYRRIALSTQLIRYADDFVVITRSRNILDKLVVPAINTFLKERGLWLSPQKTKQFCLSQKNVQIDFLGYTFKYNPKWSYRRTMIFSRQTEGAIALYPNRMKVITFIDKLQEIFKNSQNLSAMELITKLNPIIRGWANYYNLDNSSHYRSKVKEALYRLTWEWMRAKHPTLGKIALAEMYFLRKNTVIEGVVDQDSPMPNESVKKGYRLFKNYKWVLYGISKTSSRFRNKDITRIAYLLNPVNSTPIVAAIKHLIPNTLLNVHAFEDKISELIKLKLRISLQSSSKTPTLKEKLYKKQEGKCHLCDKMIDFEYLHQNSVHIHHIMPIKSGGDKFSLKNLALTHSWCHREHKH